MTQLTDYQLPWKLTWKPLKLIRHRVKCYLSTKQPNNCLEGELLQYFRRRDSLMVVDSDIMFGDQVVILQGFQTISQWSPWNHKIKSLA